MADADTQPDPHDFWEYSRRRLREAEERVREEAFLEFWQLAATDPLVAQVLTMWKVGQFSSLETALACLVVQLAKQNKAVTALCVEQAQRTALLPATFAVPSSPPLGDHGLPAAHWTPAPQPQPAPQPAAADEPVVVNAPAHPPAVDVACSVVRVSAP